MGSSTFQSICCCCAVPVNNRYAERVDNVSCLLPFSACVSDNTTDSGQTYNLKNQSNSLMN